MKVGDKVKGFKFTTFRNSANLSYNKQMDHLVGVEGVVTDVGNDKKSLLPTILEI